MVRFCLVPTCKNTTKVKKPNLYYFGVPAKDAQLRAAWFKAVKVQDPFSADELKDREFKDGRVVCSEHFASSDYERNLKDELLGINRKKKLKPEAVPWLFLPPEPDEEEVLEGNEPEVGVETRQTRKSSSLGQNVQSRSLKNLPKVGCLICSKSPVKKDYDTKHSLLGANGSDILNKQLWNVFILEKILGFPSVKCQKLLEKHGKTRHPFGWFHLCVGCADAAAKTMQMHEEILTLQSRMQNMIKTLDGRLVRNLKSQRDEKLKQTDAEVDLRNALREHKGLAPIVVVKLENLDDMDENSNTEMPYHHPAPTLSDIIRQKVDSLLKRNEDLLTSTKAVYGDIPTPISSKPTSTPINNESKSKSVSSSPHSGIVSSRRNAAEKSSRGQRILLLKPKQTNATKAEESIRKFAVKVVQNSISQSHSQGVEGTGVCSSTNVPETINSVNMILQRKTPRILRERTEAPLKSCSQRVWVPAAKVFPSGVGPANANPISNEGNGKSDSNLFYEPETSECVDVMRQNKHQRKVPHILREHEDATLRAHQYQCPICSTRLNTPVLYQNHLLQHKKSGAMQNEFDCPYCLYPFHNNLDLGRHLRKKHASQMHSLKKVCDICGFTVPKVLESKWRTHVLQHKIHDFKSDRPGEYGCTFCDEYFTTKHKLSRHKRLEHAHELGVDCFLCTDCGRTFLTKASLDTHISVHHSEENEFICELCGTRLSTAHALKWHLKKHNTNPQKKDDKCVCICIKCNLQFKNLASLQDHQLNFYGHVISDDGENPTRRKGRGRTHPLSLVPQECKYCHTTLPHFAALRRHLKIHSKFKCSICGNAYMTKDNMYKHKRRVHSTGDTRTRCRYCDKEFEHRMNVFAHYRYCSGVRKLSSDTNTITCELCNRGFRNKSGYNGHLHLCKKTAVLASGTSTGESSSSNNVTTIDNNDSNSDDN